MSPLLIVIAMFVGMSSNLTASCCSSASASGIPRLLPHERAVIELTSGLRYLYGSSDQKTKFTLGHYPENPHLMMEEEVVLITRLADFFEPFVRLPIRVQKSDTSLGAGFADMSVGVRLPLLKDNAVKALPALSLLASIRLPTGASLATDKTLSNEDIIGSGSTQFTVGMSLEKTWREFTYGLAYNLSFEPNHVRNANRIPGIIHAPIVTIGFRPRDESTITLALAPSFHTQTVFNGRAIPDSDKRKLSLSAGLMWTIHSHIKLNVNVGTDMPLPFFTKNVTNELFVRLGMRLGVF